MGSTRAADNRQLVIGVDPGPIPGVCGLICAGGELADLVVLQCNYQFVVPAVLSVIRGLPHHGLALQVEQYVVGRGGLASAGSQGVTREVVSRITGVWPAADVKRATDVKPWAHLDRLVKSGLYTPTKNMPHARDAAKHALYAAVRYGFLRDPLSQRSNARR